MTGENQITQHYGSGGQRRVRSREETNQLDGIAAHSGRHGRLVPVRHPERSGQQRQPPYGNAVKLRHANGWCTLYAHMDYISVENGQTVKKGQKLGYMGNTGNSYGAHLHFEVRDKSDARVNPEPYLNADLPGAGGGADTSAGYTGDLTYCAYTQQRRGSRRL